MAKKWLEMFVSLLLFETPSTFILEVLATSYSNKRIPGSIKNPLIHGCCYIFPRLVRGRPSAWPGGHMRSHDDDHCFVMIFIQISL